VGKDIAIATRRAPPISYFYFVLILESHLNKNTGIPAGLSFITLRLRRRVRINSKWLLHNFNH
jgi:hypothetical protein